MKKKDLKKNKTEKSKKQTPISTIEKYNLDINTMRIKSNSFELIMQKQLENKEYKKAWLKESIQDYIETHNHKCFMRALKYFIEADYTLENFAQKFDLTGKRLEKLLTSSTSPNAWFIFQILSALDFKIEIPDIEEEN